jgi:CRISPR-associated protein Cmr2
MTAHLLALTVGPVQEFIAAARRTRDLWFGSYLLSEVSKAAAKAVTDHVGIGGLVFPAPTTEAALELNSLLSIANIVVAEVGEGDPAAIARKAKEAARSCWRSFADSVSEAHRGVIDRELWDDQLDDVLEFYAAWCPYTSQTYREDRAALMRLLAARKLCRDFPPARGRAGVPKSSLDGLRESVLRDPRAWPRGPRRRLRLGEGEQLDVVGMVKRAWTQSSAVPRFPSVERVAADPWLRRVSGSRDFDALIKACCDLGSDVVHEIDTSEDRGNPQYAAFPFEGTPVFRSRHRELCQETELSDSDLRPLVQVLERLTGEHGEPSPYLGVLVADGDRMGKALSNLQSPDDHRAFSRALASFAGKARGIVNVHDGVLIYSGGDDVLAFVPIDRCLQCARALHDAFGDELMPWATKTGTELTLSVGLAIAHFMEPLEDLLRYGRAAEGHAKRPLSEDSRQQDRNGLAVHLVKRGGGSLGVRANWLTNPDKHLMKLTELIRRRSISRRIAYDMHKIAAVYDSWPEDSVADAIQRDALSVMQGKRPRGTSRMEDINDLIRSRVENAASLRSLANELLLANELAAGEILP